MPLNGVSLLCGYGGLPERASAHPNPLGAAGPRVSSRLTTHVSEVQYTWDRVQVSTSQAEG